MRTVHGGLLLAALALPMLVPVRPWPDQLLLPLCLYAILVCLIPRLRRSVHWFAIGKLSGSVWLVTFGIILLTSAVLVSYYFLVRPDLSPLREAMPLHGVMPLLLAGAVFSLLNALMEELIFRGVLMDALEASVGSTVAFWAQGVAFGAVHSRGYPSGLLGIVLATIYGLILGGMKRWTGGLAAGYIAHVFADVTIFVIVVCSAG